MNSNLICRLSRWRLPGLLWAVLMVLSPVPGMATDISLPAQIQLIILDEDDQPIPGVRLTFQTARRGWPESAPELFEAVDGKVLVKRSRPAAAAGVSWDEFVQIQAKGFLPVRTWLSFYPEAQLEQTIRMERSRTTRIRLRGPDGEPLARISLKIRYLHQGYQYTDDGCPRLLLTDERGECSWKHGRLSKGFHIANHPAEEFSSDAPIVTVHYSAEELPRPVPILRGRLLHADDSAAEGWFVVRGVRNTAVSGSFSSIIRPDSMRYRMQVDELTRIGPEGTFEVDAEQFLTIVSPEGIPMLYHLAPETWEEKIRNVTLHVPEIRHRLAGQIVDQAGQPVAGFPLEIDTVRWEGKHWNFVGGCDSAYKSWSLEASDGSAINTFRTDAQGRYTVPSYFGTSISFVTFGEGWSFDSINEPGQEAKSVLKRRQSKELPPLKKLILIYQDERGQPVSNVSRLQMTTFCQGRAVYSFESEGNSSRGPMFVDETVDRLELTFPDSLPAHPKQTIDVSGPEDRTIHITLPDAVLKLPLAGQVLDPDGHAVKQVRVLLYYDLPEERKNDFLGKRTVTDDEGRFRFDTAPDQCRIEIHADSERPALPGWMSPVVVDRTSRDVTIRLQPGGRLRVLLPEGIGSRAEGMYINHDEVQPDLPRRHRNSYFRQSSQRNELYSEVLQPGQYHLSNYNPDEEETFSALAPEPVTIVAGQETVMDLRDRLLPPPVPPPPKIWVTVAVHHDRQNVSGAEAYVLSSLASPEEISRWIEEAGSDQSQVRKKAIEKLSGAGAMAIDRIRTLPDTEQRAELLHELKEVDSDGLEYLLSDLTDDSGQVRCQMEPGRHGIAIARMRGRMIGWQEFVAGDQPVVLSLQPARTLVVHRLPKEEDKNHWEWMTLRLQTSPLSSARALMAVLCVTHPSFPESDSWIEDRGVFKQQYPMQRRDTASWILEDLPADEEVTISLNHDGSQGEESAIRQRTITIEPGGPPLQVKF